MTRVECVSDIITSLLNLEKGNISAELDRVGLGRVRHIEPFFHNNIDSDMMPMLMVQEEGMSGSWQGLPNLGKDSFTFKIYGFLRHDNMNLCSIGRRVFADATVQALNHRNVWMKLKDAHRLQFVDNQKPVTSIDYAIGRSDDPFVKGFTINYAAQIIAVQN
jgi:hypothetical protein